MMLGSVFVVPEIGEVGYSSGDEQCCRGDPSGGDCSCPGPNGTTATSTCSSPAWLRSHLTQSGDDPCTGAPVGAGEARPPQQSSAAAPRARSLPNIPPIQTHSKVKHHNAGEPKCPGRCANGARSVHEVSSRRKAERRAAAARIRRDEHFRVTPLPGEPTPAPSPRESPGREHVAHEIRFRLFI